MTKYEIKKASSWNLRKGRKPSSDFRKTIAEDLHALMPEYAMHIPVEVESPWSGTDAEWREAMKRRVSVMRTVLSRVLRDHYPDYRVRTTYDEVIKTLIVSRTK